MPTAEQIPRFIDTQIKPHLNKILRVLGNERPASPLQFIADCFVSSSIPERGHPRAWEESLMSYLLNHDVVARVERAIATCAIHHATVNNPLEYVGKLLQESPAAEEAVPPPSARAAAASAKKRILKDGVAVNDSIYPKVGVPSDPEGITKEWLTDCLVSRKIIAANNCVASMESTQIGEGRGYANVSPLLHHTSCRLIAAASPPDAACAAVHLQARGDPRRPSSPPRSPTRPSARYSSQVRAR